LTPDADARYRRRRTHASAQLEAERSVLGAILLHNDAFNLAAEVIDANDFFRDATAHLRQDGQARRSATTRSTS
jgi:hypothetical protein